MRLPGDKVARLRAFYGGRRVGVTGGAGFIGGHLVDALLSLGAVITVIDDLSNSTTAHLSELIELEPDRVRFVHGSILDDVALAEAMGTRGAPGPVQTVFHLGALGSVPRSMELPARTWEVNATGTLRILEGARAAGGARVVLAASSSAYGDDPSLPKVESMAPRPMSPYAASKLAAETLCGSWSRSYGLATVCLRYFNVFGPRQPADSAYAAVVAAFARRILAGEAPVVFGDGSASRDFTYVANAVLATLLAGAVERPPAGDVLNIGTGRRTTVVELAELMQGVIAREGGTATPARIQHAPARAGDVPHSVADIARARQVLGYEVVASLEEGLGETVAWYRQALAGADSA
jgi:nucleoside-diphosphate-sugar epimerase